jgi:tetratricopeptide (TPR) repeat protein
LVLWEVVVQFRFLGAHTPYAGRRAPLSKAHWPLFAVAPADEIRSLPARRGLSFVSCLRTSHMTIAAIALALLLSLPGILSPTLSAQEAAAKNWKDRAEYDLFISIQKETDPAKRLELLNQWQDKYPQTDYNKERFQFFVATTAAAGQPQKTLDYAKQLLKIDPKDFTSLYYICLFGPGVYGANASADQQATVQSAAQGMIDGVGTAFDDKKKPASLTADQWTTAKNQTTAIAHNALGWLAKSKKDFGTAEKEYGNSLQLNPAAGQVAYELAGIYQLDHKYQEAVFYYARAAAFDGTGALPADARAKVLTYLTDRVYLILHGSKDGLDAVLATAKTNATMPAGFHVVTVDEVEGDKAKRLQAFLDANPDQKLWYTVQQALIADGGQAYFDANVKDAELPGGAQDVKMFKGTVMSLDPAEKPTKVVLNVFAFKNTPDEVPKADATLVFEDPITAPVKVGDVIEFSGVADSFTKDPYMLTFKDPSAPALKPAEKPKPKRPRPAKKTS